MQIMLTKKWTDVLGIVFVNIWAIFPYSLASSSQRWTFKLNVYEALKLLYQYDLEYAKITQNWRFSMVLSTRPWGALSKQEALLISKGFEGSYIKLIFYDFRKIVYLLDGFIMLWNSIILYCLSDDKEKSLFFAFLGNSWDIWTLQPVETKHCC